MTETQTKESTSSPKEKVNEGDPEVVLDTPHSTIVIKTAEDAQVQYLRGKITEEQMRQVFAAHGVTSIQTVPNIEPIDNAFERKIPEDLVEGPAQLSTVEERMEQAEQKAKVREASEKAAEKVEAETKPETDLATLQNREANKAGEKVEEKQEDPVVAKKTDEKK